MTDDVIEQAMRVMDDYGNGYDGLNQLGEREALAQALDRAGLLRQKPTGDDWGVVDFLTEFIETVRDEPQFTDAEHALMGAGEMGRAGLLRQEPPTRDEIADELSGWPIGGGYYGTSVGIDEAGEMADAVLTLLKGEN